VNANLLKYFVICKIFIFANVMAFCASFEQELNKISADIEKEKWPVAISKLESLSKSSKLSEKEHGIAVCLLARCYRENGNFDKALKALESLSTGRPSFYFSELGELCLADGKFDKALLAGDSCAGVGNKTAAMDGAWLKARADWSLKKYQDCIDECEKVKAAGAALLAANESQKTDADAAIAKIIAAAEELAAKAKDALEMELYGSDYLHYRKGREAEAKGRFDDAVKNYARINGGVLKDAGECYTAHCLGKLGKDDDAINLYKEIIEKDSGSLYCGEALYNAAILSYLSGKTEKAEANALKFASDAADWCETASKIEDSAKALAGINSALTKNIINPMRGMEFMKLDDCGNLIRNKTYPGSIVNHLTAPWYLPHLATRAQLLKGYLLGETGKKSEAAEAYRKGAELSEKARILSDASTLPALLAGLVENGYLVPEECFEKMSHQSKKLINFAFFFFVSEERSYAEQIIKLIEDDPKLSERPGDATVIAFAKSACLLSAKNKKDGLKTLKSIIGTSKQASLPVQKWAKYVYACQIASDPSQKSAACAMLEELGQEKKSRLAPMAMLSLACCHFNYGDLDNASKIGAKLRSGFTGTPWSEAGGTLRDGAEPLAVNAEKGKPIDLKTLLGENADTRYGKILDRRFTIVLGGNSRMRFDSDDLSASDIMLCKLTYVSRSNCTIIRGVRTTLGLFEPQPPAVQGNRIAFIRAPLLFSKRFLYDFDKELASGKKQTLQ